MGPYLYNFNNTIYVILVHLLKSSLFPRISILVYIRLHLALPEISVMVLVTESLSRLLLSQTPSFLFLSQNQLNDSLLVITDH